MNFFYQFPNDTKYIKLPIVIDIKGIVFIPDDLESTILNESIELDCRFLLTVNSSSGLPLTKKGVPFLPIRFVNISYNYSARLKLDDNDIINWSPLKFALEDVIRSSDLFEYDENISHNIDLFLVYTKIY